MRKGSIAILAGIFCFFLAAGLTAYNLWDNSRAGENAEKALAQLDLLIAEPSESVENIRNEIEYPDYVLNPFMALPVVEIEGNAYVGKLTIPALGKELPILSEWSYSHLKIAPCLYAGTPYRSGFVICAHNYYYHFGDLRSLNEGDEIFFTDNDGNEFAYVVKGSEILQPQSVADMKSKQWDLTLFTCTVGGATRVTVRCVRK